jgi:hypothetical protein
MGAESNVPAGAAQQGLSSSLADCGRNAFLPDKKMCVMPTMLVAEERGLAYKPVHDFATAPNCSQTVHRAGD